MPAFHRLLPLLVVLGVAANANEIGPAPDAKEFETKDADKMPFAFDATLRKFLVVLEPENLSEEEKQLLRAQEAAGAMSLQ